MFLKRFRGATVRDALSACRQELGPNALVLSTTMVAARGWRGMMGVREVELTAGLEREASVARPEGSENRHVPTSTAAAQLVATGLDRALAEEVAGLLPKRIRRGPSAAQLRQALSNRISELAAVAQDYQPIEVFVGPPGAGKTTTVAKIAAQARALRGARFSLIAADGFRVGAIDQLRTYADILDAPFHATPSNQQLEALLTDMTMTGMTDVPMLVDTAGRAPSDPDAHELFGVLRRLPAVRTHLVLPATTSPTMARRLIDSYADAQPSRLVLTKLDEVESLSPLVSVLRDVNVPVSYLCSGQRVPEDLAPATADLLASCVLGDSPAAVALH